MTRNAKKLLFLTTYEVGRSDLGGASWVDSRLISALSDRYDVTIFPIVDRSDNMVVPLEIRKQKATLPLLLLRILLLREPYQEAKFKWSRAWRCKSVELEKTLDRGNFDLIVTSQWPALMMMADLKNSYPFVHIAHNVDTVIAAEYDPAPLRWIGNAKRTEVTERKLMSRPSAVFSLSRTDSVRLRGWGVAARHLLLLDVVAGKNSSRKLRHAIGFIGKSSWPPNRDVIEHLKNLVLPELQRRMGEKAPSLVIAGAGSEKFSNEGDIEGIGVVGDIGDFYSRIDLVVVPRMGVTTGVSVKLLEAIEMGILAIAPRGLSEDAGVSHHCIPADSVDDTSARIQEFYAVGSIDHTSQSPVGDSGIASVSLGNLGALLETFVGSGS
ncbi:glycosyltransferase family 4 protein [Rhodococcus sp. MS16]|uniref:glycosyltransferase n=1 Tax=Rhodococcus TaxID=1827 RepID=UPI001561C8CE|nr:MULTISPECIES: glycosyltransferase [Rhodococcus]MCE4268201.1 glycosyltransferase [Rhodococcus globerulus]NRI66949.1 glycosyltransferase family 4 protein [Rhodococcus sp. MS16]